MEMQFNTYMIRNQLLKKKDLQIYFESVWICLSEEKKVLATKKKKKVLILINKCLLNIIVLICLYL